MNKFLRRMTRSGQVVLVILKTLVSRLLSSNAMVRRTSATNVLKQSARHFADTPPRPDETTKSIVAQGESEQRVRVRRARPSDVPRVLRFVRQNSRSAWPSLMPAPLAPPAASHLMLADYVSRALAQGHSMIAEQIGTRRGWVQVKGLALGAAVCQWDAAMLERWASCLRCTHSRRLINFSAHCLRAPALHDKYKVHKILQVIMILPPESQANPEIIQVLAKNAIQRGREVGFPLLRFDVNNESVAKALEELDLTKEWYLSYDIVPEPVKEKDGGAVPAPEISKNFIAVYSAFTTEDNTNPG